MKNIVDFTSKIKEKFTMRKDIAPVEESSTASRAYSAGDKFYYGNLLQKAITDIAQGAAFVGGTNFENADPVTTTIQNLSNQVKNNINHNGCKNLFDFDIAEYSYAGSSLVFSYGDNCLNITTGGSAGGEFYYPNLSMKRDKSVMKPSTDYVLSCGESAITGLGMSVFYKAVGSSEWTLLASNVGEKSLRFTTPAAFDEIWARFNISSAATVGTGTIYPMLCLASDYDLDPSFELWTETNRQLTKNIQRIAENIVNNGCKNIVSLPKGTYEYKGVRYVTDENGIVTVSRYQSNSGDAFSAYPYTFYKAGDYVVSLGGEYVPSTMDVFIFKQGIASSVAEMSGTYTEFNIPTDGYYVFSIRVRSSQSPSNVSVKPMICHKSDFDLDQSWQPPAKTNKELTDVLSQKFAVVTGTLVSGNVTPTAPTGFTAENSVVISSMVKATDTRWYMASASGIDTPNNLAILYPQVWWDGNTGLRVLNYMEDLVGRPYKICLMRTDI